MAGARHVVGALIASLALAPNAGCGSAGTSQSTGSRIVPGVNTSGGEGALSGATDAGVSASEPSLGAEIVDLAEQSAGQQFIALLRPLNAGVNGRPVRAVASVSIEGDVLDVVVLAKGLAPEMEHMQRIQGFVPTALAACPPFSADVNHDRIIDVVEGASFFGAILIPLDSDLDDLGAQTFPSASAAGILRYEQKDSVRAIEHELGEPLDLETRVIALHGVAPNMPLPQTVQTLPGSKPSFTLPVACGELVRVK